MPVTGRAWLATLGAVAGRPYLWPTAVRQGSHLLPRHWWRTPPHLPLPDRRYLRFRALTQYGDPGRAPTPSDVVTWLQWCRLEQKSLGHSAGAR
ncbi:MAG: hypothetical protein JWL70_2646 [Acidimicrobiia bacterium]|nr:hypothetical protein [Acidimicrobiia bacterium]